MRVQERGPLTNLIVRFVINTAALVAAAYILNFFAPGSIIGLDIENWQTVLIVSIMFGTVNALIKPLVSCFTCLLQAMTLGLFTLVINAFMLLLTAWFAEQFGIVFYVNGFGAAFFGAIIVSVVSMVLTSVLE